MASTAGAGRPSRSVPFGGAAGYTPHQGKFLAYWLTLRSRGEESVTRALASARVDMNPHQVDAALFALQSPVAAGALLADEVGLGKTIEAGLVIAQRWAQQRRRILLVVPATLRRQWRQELADKFGLPAEILESKTFSEAIRAGNKNPFQVNDALVITSYEFAASRKRELAVVAWDLVVLDEAHKLRNLYKGEDASKRATALNEALRGRRKVLLTATPFQNSLLELYGLVSFISDEFFGSLESFQLQYTGARNLDERLRELKQRLKPICHRTLRRQVQQEGGINFTKRFSITQDFTPSDDELELYEKVSAYLQDDSILAIKPGARHLVTLVIRKILASSSFAIGETLDTIISRLKASRALDTTMLADFDAVDGTADELGIDPAREPIQGELLGRDDEIQRLSDYRELARRIRTNRKGEALLVALKNAFEMAYRLGGQRKAVIFTESVRTQTYLRELLENNGYAGKTVLLNGSNNDPDSKAVYARWLKRHDGTDTVSRSKTADMKAAIVDAFREERDILIATEAGGEGINLQFCSLLINYDLPWNPQRVEQRIGRVHRYGQKHDAVVVNFVNRKNRADELVYELLAKKFKLFDGVFGASDEILGAIESGVDIERSINDIYRHCRDPATIGAEFARLQAELDATIQQRELRAKQILLENFDEDVVRNLRTRREETRRALSVYEQQFLRLIRAVRPEARFEHDLVHLDEGTFAVSWPPAERANAGLLRPDDGLGAAIVALARDQATPGGTLRFQYSKVDGQLADVRDQVGARGTLRLAMVELETAAELVQELVAVAVLANGKPLSRETAERLLQVPATFEPAESVRDAPTSQAFAAAVDEAVERARKRNDEWFQRETDRLDRWAEDQRMTLRAAVDRLDEEIKASKRFLRQLGTLEEKAQAKRSIRHLEQQRDDALLRFYERRKEIASREEQLLDEVETNLRMTYRVHDLFEVAWVLES